MEAPATPVVFSENDAAVTPLTDSLNVTVKLTLAAFVGIGLARTTDDTVGAVLSTV
jgi:hypothetical protein